MKRASRFAVLSLLLVAASARAQDAEPLKHLAPYLGDDSFVIGWIDVRNVDVAPMLERFRKAGAEKTDVDGTQAMLQAMKSRLIDAGVTRVYITNIGDISQFEPLLVVPTAKVQAVRDAFAVEKALPTRIVGESVLIGKTETLDKAVKRSGKANAEWAAALGKVSSHPSQFVILPPRVFLKVFAEVQPELPAELGGGSTADVFNSLKWASIGFDLSAQTKIDGVVQFKDEAAAKRIDPIVDHLIAAVKKHLPVRDVPTIANLLDNHRPKQVGDQMRVSLDEKSIDAAFVPLAANARQNAQVSVSINNLKQIALATHIYHDKYKSFPPQASEGKDKKPLLSWRVQILPYIEEAKLYNEFHHDEPWDSEHNKKLIAKMPRMYHSPLSKLKIEDGKTTYVVPAGPKLVFDGIQKTPIRKIVDGTSNTILAFDVDDGKAVIWTKPEDYPVEQKKVNAGVSRPGVNRIIAAFCDGSVRQLSGQTSDEDLWYLCCPNDGQIVEIK